MRQRESALTITVMLDIFTSGDHARIYKCTIDRLCRTQIFEFCGAALDATDSPCPQIIYCTDRFRATIVDDPQIFLNESQFSPHYAASYSLRKEIDDLRTKTHEADRHDRRLFVVMEEHRAIEPTAMHRGECVLVDQTAMHGGQPGQEAILALRSSDGAWPDESIDRVSENIVLAAIKIAQNITYGTKALLDRMNFLEHTGTDCSYPGSVFRHSFWRSSCPPPVRL